MAKIEIPQIPFFINPVLQALKKLGGSGSNQEINDMVAKITNLSKEQLEVLHNAKTGKLTKVNYNIAWARTHLKHYGIIKNRGRAIWELTEIGEQTEHLDGQKVSNFNFNELRIASADPNYWIFQGNPKQYNVVDAISNDELYTWSVSAHKDKIKTGDKVILWITGDNRGCYALCEVKSEIYEDYDDEIDAKYRLDQDKNKLHSVVKINITHDLSGNPITTDQIDSIKKLSKLKVGNQGTNFEATEEEYQIILEMAEKMNNSFQNLVNHFEIWYKESNHSENEDFYKDILTHNYLVDLSDGKFIDFFYDFCDSGGKVQSGGERTKNQFKQAIIDNFTNFKKYVLLPFQNDFDPIDWLERNEEFNYFGIGLATIYLNRVDKSKYSIVNNKAKDGLKILGFEVGKNDKDNYLNINGFQKRLIENYSEFNNYYKADSFNQFIIGENDGINIIKEMIADWIIDQRDMYCFDERLSTRKAGENEMKDILEEKNGKMTEQDWRTFFGLTDKDFYDDEIKYTRFGMGFRSNSKSMLLNLDLLNRWTQKFWETKESQISELIDKYFKEERPKGAGQLFISFILYLKDPEKYAIWLKAEIDGIRKFHNFDKTGKNGASYKEFNEFIINFNRRHNLAHQEADIILGHFDTEYDDPFSVFSKEGSIVNRANNSTDKNFWLYTPGSDARHWDEFYKQGIMGLNWDEVGDLNQYESRDEINEKMREEHNDSKDHSPTTLILDNFKNKMKVGDVIIAKNGIVDYIGYGIITSDYFYDTERSYYKKCRKINWIKKGHWKDKNRTIGSNFLIQLSQDSDYVADLIKLIGIETEAVSSSVPDPSYTPPSLNTILYGPPGTGKTYNTILKAAEIVSKRSITDYDEAKRIFNENLTEQIEFVTFHQNYSYEDFIQGLRPDTEGDDSGLRFEKKDGVFKRIADRAKENLDASKKEPEEIKRLFDDVFQELINPLNEGEVDEIEIPMKKVSYFITGITRRSIEFRKDSGVTSHTLSISTLKKMYNAESVLNMQGLASYYKPLLSRLLKAGKSGRVSKESIKENNYVIIIDEINRANISRVFGELITLIEPDKRSGGKIPLTCTLPSGDEFIVPSNLFIVGTMNTADKSIALLDIALRRRFDFEPMYPKYEIDGEMIDDWEILEKINKKIVKDKGHDFQIGHSYFMEKGTTLVQRMNRKVIPLLLEYFMNNKEDVVEILKAAGLEIDKDAWPIRIKGNKA